MTNVPGSKQHISSMSCDIDYHVSAVSFNHTKLNIVNVQSDWLTAGTPILLSEGHNYINSSQKKVWKNNFHYIFMQSFKQKKISFGCFYLAILWFPRLFSHGLSCYPRSKFCLFTTGTLVSGDVLKCQIECNLNRWLSCCEPKLITSEINKFQFPCRELAKCLWIGFKCG